MNFIAWDSCLIWNPHFSICLAISFAFPSLCLHEEIFCLHKLWYVLTDPLAAVLTTIIKSCAVLEHMFQKVCSSLTPGALARIH